MIKIFKLFDHISYFIYISHNNKEKFVQKISSKKKKNNRIYNKRLQIDKIKNIIGETNYIQYKCIQTSYNKNDILHYYINYIISINKKIYI